MEQIAVRICGFVKNVSGKTVAIDKNYTSKNASEASEISQVCLRPDEKNQVKR